MSKRICTVRLGDNIMDNDYTIYDDGSVEKYYDQSIYNHSIEETTHVKDLHESIKERLLEKCNESSFEELEDLFDNYS